LVYPSCSIRFAFVMLGLHPVWAAHKRVPACGENAPQRGFAALQLFGLRPNSGARRHAFILHQPVNPTYIPPSAAFRQHFAVREEIESRGARRRRAERSEVLHEGRALAYPSCSIRFAFVTLGLYPRMGGAQARSRLRRERATARLRRAARCSDFARTAGCAAMLYPCTQKRR